jgi:hypothetical protein
MVPMAATPHRSAITVPLRTSSRRTEPFRGFYAHTVTPARTHTHARTRTHTHALCRYADCARVGLPLFPCAP